MLDMGVWTRGSRQLHAPGRHPCGPGRSQHTDYPGALCAEQGAHWCPHDRGGHRCANPTMAPLLPAEVATLGVALGEEMGFMKDERGSG